MAKVNPWVVGGAVVASGVVVVLLLPSGAGAAHRRVVGLPSLRGVSYRVAEAGYVDVLVDGAFVQTAASAARARAGLMAAFAVRRKTLPPDADPSYIDRFSKSYFGLPTWILDGNVAGANYRVFDEFGRLKPGHVGFGGGIGDSFTRLLANPLTQLVVQAAVLYATGPAGLAAYGAVRAYAERGSEFTLKDAALASAKTAAVSYCGAACGMAFEFGVGVASGESIDGAAERALLGQMTPEQRVAFDQGETAYSKLR